MDGIREWSAALCFAALGCTAVQLLAPKDGVGRVFRLAVNTFFLLCMLMPLTRVRSFGSLSVERLPASVVSDLLEDTVTRQLETQVRAAVETLAEEALAERGVRAEKIEVGTDISADGSIYIQHVTVAVDKQSVPQAKLAGEVLTARLEVPVEVITRER